MIQGTCRNHCALTALPSWSPRQETHFFFSGTPKNCKNPSHSWRSPRHGYTPLFETSGLETIFWLMYVSLKGSVGPLCPSFFCSPQVIFSQLLVLKQTFGKWMIQGTCGTTVPFLLGPQVKKPTSFLEVPKKLQEPRSFLEVPKTWVPPAIHWSNCLLVPRCWVPPVPNGWLDWGVIDFTILGLFRPKLTFVHVCTNACFDHFSVFFQKKKK